MKFTVTARCNIVCDGCGASTLVTGGNIYNTDDLTCLCDAIKYPPLIPEEELVELTDRPMEHIPMPFHNSKVGKAEKRENKNQAKMFEPEPIGVIEDEADMTEEEVRAFLAALVWNDLMASAKNNGVIKPREAGRKELTELIVQKVFYTEEEDIDE